MSRLRNPGGNNSGGLPGRGTGGGDNRGGGNRGGGTGGPTQLADYVFTPRSSSGGELYGAIISGYDGEAWKSVVHTSQGKTKLSVPAGPDLSVSFLGRTLFRGSYDEFKSISTVGAAARGSRRPEITLETTFDVQGVGIPFSGAEAALVMSGEILVSWLPESGGMVEVSAAATTAELFTESSATLTTPISRGIARVPDDASYNVAAVRRVGTSRAFGHVTVHREPSITDTGAYTLALLLSKAWQGREVLVRAQAGNHSVTFSADGADIVEATDQFARVKITALQASITATASDGQTQTTALTHHLRPVPNAPQVTTQYTSGSDAVIEWHDETVPDDITYLVQAAPSLRRAKEAIPTHTYDQRAAFTPRLGLNYMIVRAVDVLGRVSDPAEIQVIHGSPASRVVGRRTTAIPTIHTAGSSNGRTLLLSDYVTLSTPNDETQSAAWQEIEADIFTTTHASVTKGGASWQEVDVFAEVSGPQPVLIRLRREGFRPLWIGFVARISLTSPESKSFSGAKVGEFGNTIDIDVPSFVGADPALVVSGAKVNTLRIARPLAVRGMALEPKVFDDATPQYAIFEGSKGYGLFMLSDEPHDRSPSLPFMPEGTDSTSYAEEPGWSAFDPMDERAHEWNAAQTTGGEFFEVSRKRLPRQIIEEAPENLAIRGLSVSASSATSARVTWRLENALTGADVRLLSSGATTVRSSSPTRSGATCLILTSRLGLSLRVLLGKTATSSVSMVHFGTNSSAETSSVTCSKQGYSANSANRNTTPV